jgi:hypothetical protein
MRGRCNGPAPRANVGWGFFEAVRDSVVTPNPSSLLWTEPQYA